MQDPTAIPASSDLVEPGMLPTAMDLLNSYSGLFVAAFVVTLLATPIVRAVALSLGAIDRPDLERKNHIEPVPYLGGVAVFLGLAVALGLSYLGGDLTTGSFLKVPIGVVLGMVAVLVTGLADDLWGWDPRLKIAGQLVAAAALAINDVGVRVAEGVLAPLMGSADLVLFTVGGFAMENGDVYYWVGTALVAIFVLGGCNSANLLDGLDGLLSGVVAIVVLGLLAISLLMVSDPMTAGAAEGSLAGVRVVMCVALLGAVLGFLPHNFRPATIFLGDCGSLLIGYTCAVIILMLGEHGQTHLVFAGLIAFSVPIMDTTLAIIRRRLAGTSMSAADDQHLHHQLCRMLGGVHRAVLALYALTALFTIIGVTLAWLVIATELRVRVIYAIALVVFSFIGVTGFKAARMQQLRLDAVAAQRSARRRPAAVDKSAAAVDPPSRAKPSPR